MGPLLARRAGSVCRPGWRAWTLARPAASSAPTRRVPAPARSSRPVRSWPPPRAAAGPAPSWSCAPDDPGGAVDPPPLPARGVATPTIAGGPAVSSDRRNPLHVRRRRLRGGRLRSALERARRRVDRLPTSRPAAGPRGHPRPPGRGVVRLRARRRRSWCATRRQRRPSGGRPNPATPAYCRGRSPASPWRTTPSTTRVLGARRRRLNRRRCSTPTRLPAAGRRRAPAWTADFGPTRPSREPTVAGGVVYVPLVGTSSVAPAVVAVVRRVAVARMPRAGAGAARRRLRHLHRGTAALRDLGRRGRARAGVAAGPPTDRRSRRSSRSARTSG